MTFIPDKPACSFEEQIQILRDRNLIINNEQYAKWCFSNYGYYSLINGYSKPFLKDIDNEIYKDDILFERIVQQYKFDRDIKSITFQRIIDCENHLKTVLGNVIAESFGVYDKLPDDAGYVEGQQSYLFHENFVRKQQLGKLIAGIRKTRNTISQNPTKYYREQKNHIPPWILFRNISLWDAKTLYQVLKRTEKTLCTPSLFPYQNLFSEEEISKSIVDSYELLREFRNNMAHGSRAFAKKSKASLNLKAIEKILGPDIVDPSKHAKGYGRNDLFAFLLTIIIFSNEPEVLLSMFIDLENLTKKYIEIDNAYGFSSYEDFLSHSSLPNDYLEKLVRAYRFKYSLV